MKRIQHDRFGGPETMYLADVVTPPVGRRRVRVSVKASSINEIDWKLRQGYMKILTGHRFPRGMGIDFSGVVDAVGPDSPFEEGDDVFGGMSLRAPGSFAEQLVTDIGLIARKPDNVSHEVAATLPVVAGTAWQALTKYGNMKPGDRVFVNGGYGSLGQSAVHIARALGAGRVVARVSPDHFAAVTNIGANKAISYAEPIPADMQNGFDLVLDAHGSLDVRNQSFLMARGGVVLDVNPDPGKRLRALLPHRKSVLGTLKSAVLDELAKLAAAGQLEIAIGQSVPLSHAITAITELEQGRRVTGKTVIVVP